MSLLLHLQLFTFCLALSQLRFVASHQESGDSHCEPDAEARIVAEFMPGFVTLDGHADDWGDINGFDFPLRPALDPDEDKEYKAGKMTVKALHDGKDVYFMLQVDGDYVYSKGDNYKCPSVALMFQVGENASYHDMGGCKELPGTCNNKTCRGHEVDIMHFSIGNSIPGRLYGGNNADRIGLVDMFAWNPHCRNLDGIGSAGNESTAMNDWKGAWWHSSFTTHSGYVEEDNPYASSGQKGTYYFEFTRSMRTMDRHQQDVQFTIGQSSKFSAAFWYPIDGNPWHSSGHYTVSCDWVPLDVTPGSSTHVKVASGSSWDAAAGFAFLISVVAFCVSIFVGYRVSKTKRAIPFTPIDHL
ncbi:domon-like ligand-binding domain-containing precursor [Olea europaea subsp. europaea]|uniref:Domon-like ligand-binding domain-containing n=1 Tax=Olea europaea subsp. europaea TaxID=158383 RepID=A0A8S0USH7_OLEEU|nr:domon-like ligand-binding domain-containing precursor [Olea europaea subsp. europaea]